MPLRPWSTGVKLAIVGLLGLSAVTVCAGEREQSPPPEDEGCVIVNVGGHTAGTLDCLNYALRATVRQTKRQVAAAAQLDATSPPVALGAYNAAATAQALASRRASRPPPPPVSPVFVQPR